MKPKVLKSLPYTQTKTFQFTFVTGQIEMYFDQM